MWTPTTRSTDTTVIPESIRAGRGTAHPTLTTLGSTAWPTTWPTGTPPGRVSSSRHNLRSLNARRRRRRFLSDNDFIYFGKGTIISERNMTLMYWILISLSQWLKIRACGIFCTLFILNTKFINIICNWSII